MFEPDLQALRAADILPVFAAGNAGPNPSTSLSPANNPSAFAVGAINTQESIYGEGSRGPSACGGSNSIYPHLTAPGVSRVTTERYGQYYNPTGTSLAAPHADRRSGFAVGRVPSFVRGTSAKGILAGAVDLGISGPDMNFGYGRLDVRSAFDRLVNHEDELSLILTTLVHAHHGDDDE